MTIEECYEKFKHLDYLLSDEEWLSTESPQSYILHHCWQAICEHCEEHRPEIIDGITTETI